MAKYPKLTLQRVQLFATQRGLVGKLYTDRAPVQLSVFNAPGRIPYAEAMMGEYRPARVGEHFGPFWSTHWFKVDITIPQAWAGQEVHFLWDSSSEAEVWQNGKPVQGLTGTVTTGHSLGAIRAEYPLTRKAKGGETRTLYIEMAVNNLFGLGSTPDPVRLAEAGLLRQAEIAVFDRDAWDLLWDFKVIADMAAHLPADTPRGGQALFTANRMINAIDLEDHHTWEEARKIAAIFLSAHTGQGQLNISGIGHAHIDTAWLWPLDETRRKCTRTFSTAVLMMDEYPEYRFACSQAQQLEWMKELQPDLYERIKAKVKTGQFIPVGGSWVEPDCNLPSGEALVRQFLYGQRFFRQEFGITCQEFWEPDVFGYSAALPQIMQLAGISRFLTQKLSWNQFNKLDNHTFWWEGLDGSRVLTHFPPTDTYNSLANVEEVLYTVRNYKDLDRSREAYLLFGYGDGGGGPTREMVEQLRRMKDVDGLPRVEVRGSNDFFQRLEEDAQDLSTWVGELYFELHRGTYTTQANNKKFNRQSEFILHDVEFLSAVAHACSGHPYPKGELDRMWKMVLTNQFHDIIPGSSIHDVYLDSTESYHDILGTAAGLKNQAAVALLGLPDPHGPNVCAINTTAFARREVVALPDGMTSLQVSVDGKPLGVASVPAYGWAVAVPGAIASEEVHASEADGVLTLENDFVRAVFQRDGSLTSLYDRRAGRESIEPGREGNRLVLFDDTPNNWDAWDVDLFHLEKRSECQGAVLAKLVEHGPLRAAIAFEYQLSPSSTIRQVVSLTALSPLLTFENEVEWHERHKFLKVEFPVNVRAMNATYEVQFGHLQRPTHFNTSWDWARFEVVAHRWADLSDADYGVALLNDSKYGHAAHGNVLRLSLLRSPTAPDPEADQGRHLFRYALLPHTGGPQGSGVIEAGYHFNVPLHVFPTAANPVEHSVFSTDDPALVLDTVKKAEDSDDIILRLYEAHGTQGRTTIQTSLPVLSAHRCNLLEDDIKGSTEEEWPDSGLPVAYRPFEIISLRLKLR